MTFLAGTSGEWLIQTQAAVVGEGLPPAERVEVCVGPVEKTDASVWALSGFTSNERYVERHEREALVAVQQGLGRQQANRAALIPIRKSEAWWDLTQEERREILEEHSAHIASGLKYLPAVARRLHHSRDLSGPFDFLTWFEYGASDAAAFEELVATLRATVEWQFVDREIDIRAARANGLVCNR